MRLNYAGQDRPDLAYVCRELAKGMSEPTERHVTMLKRCARYLALKPRVVQLFKWQEFLPPCKHGLTAIMLDVSEAARALAVLSLCSETTASEHDAKAKA